MEIKDLSGISEAEASRRLDQEGFNELPSTRRRSIFAIAFEVIREPMFLLLVACGGIYLALGDLREALMLLGFVFVVMGITLYQERKTQRALEALRDLSSPRALVIRDGVERRIAGREVVREDILIIKEGDRVPADAVLVSCNNLTIDESLLTGESTPVRKSASSANEPICRPGGEDLPFIYSGTLAVQGQGIARVLATGMNTEMGRIGRSLQTVGEEQTPLQKETGRLARTLAAMGLMLCALVVVIYGLTRGDWMQGILAGITLAMATLPEEFPVVMTIFLALGAWRISKKQALTRRVPAVETLGSATVLCVDKTGTLTLNRMTVSKMFAWGEFFDVRDNDPSVLPETFHEILEFSILASQIDPFDPMEKAIKELGEKYLAETEHLHQDWTLVHEYPLSSQMLSLSRVWKSMDGSDYIIAAKGSPEAIADLCHLDREQADKLSRHIEIMADEGLRILGVAKAAFGSSAFPGKQHDFPFEFLGLIGLSDPVRTAVPHAIRECYDAGIRVIMITGDYPGTAMNIARQIGLDSPEKVITGVEMDNMSDADLHERIDEVNIFARVVPEQKLRLVNALKAHDEIVAMTGDGVNDAPALKSAHIGIAMGGRGTDVARESSALVLLDDDFSSIVQAVRMGRRIFDNINKAIVYILSIHVPIAGISLIPVLFKLPLVLMPVHIVFLELIIDPACSIVFESVPEEAGVMNRPPRDSRSPLFGKRTLAISLMQGVVVLFIILAVFSFSFFHGHGEEEARALTFTTLVIANLCLILTNLSWTQTIFSALRSRNKALWIVMGGALFFLGMVLYVPFLRSLFRFNILRAIDLWLCLGAGMLGIIWFEALKLINRYKRMNR
ncbi:cation-translocating P-type ATPase [Candidatus Sumerlaeota bacterium]|nr:cation-translocating P-type ATPase [Candidatus Sumerlaeota bacterium]